MRRFKLKKKTQTRGAEWLNRETVYEGELVSMTARIVRLFAPHSPDSEDPRPHVDLPYDWVIPVR